MAPDREGAYSVRIEKIVKSAEEALKLRTKFQSQMNNGHTVSFDSALLNPSHIVAITFEEIEDEEAEHG